MFQCWCFDTQDKTCTPCLFLSVDAWAAPCNTHTLWLTDILTDWLTDWSGDGSGQHGVGSCQDSADCSWQGGLWHRLQSGRGWPGHVCQCWWVQKIQLLIIKKKLRYCTCRIQCGLKAEVQMLPISMAGIEEHGRNVCVKMSIVQVLPCKMAKQTDNRASWLDKHSWLHRSMCYVYR